MRIISVAGARPNFMKIAPIVAALEKVPDVEHLLVHTGQHYDQRMSDVFFRDLSIPPPDVDLEVGSASHAVQTARIMVEFEKVCEAKGPDVIVVVGDVNSTMACTLVAAKLLIPVAHVEAGLRSFDRTMPEEINRLVTDSLADLLFTTSRDADENLKREGVDPGKIHFVGNVMIDTLLKHRERAAALDVAGDLGLAGKDYAVMTLHRPSNVDDPSVLKGILQVVQEISRSAPVIFPIHPRTSARINELTGAGWGFKVARWRNNGCLGEAAGRRAKANGFHGPPVEPLVPDVPDPVVKLPDEVRRASEILVVAPSFLLSAFCCASTGSCRCLRHHSATAQTAPEPLRSNMTEVAPSASLRDMRPRKSKVTGFRPPGSSEELLAQTSVESFPE